MGFSGGIAVTNIENFQLDIYQFKEALRQRWPDVQIKDGFEGNIDFDLPQPENPYGFSGSTIQQEQVGWWGDYEEFAEFCIWFRRYVPENCQLLAWSKNHHDYVVVSASITEEQFLKGFSDDRIYFEIASPLNTRDTFRTLAENFRQQWSEYIGDVSFDEREGFWYLRAQQGTIEFDNGKIIFNDNDLMFAARFVVWCRSQLLNDQKLTIRGSYYAGLQAETDLTSSTTETELLDFLTKSFAKE